MKAILFLLTALLLNLSSPGAWGLEATPSSAQSMEEARARIQAERLQQTAQLDAQDNVCLSRFAVTDCQNSVAQRRRAMLARLKHEEVKLNDAMRQQRASEQKARLQEKVEERAARSAEAATLPAPQDRQKMQNEKVRSHPQPAPSSGATAAKTKTADVVEVDAQALAEKRRAFEDKQKAAINKREEREKRLREQGPPKTPLPVPP